MKKVKRLLTAVAVVAMLCMTVSACGLKEFDASNYTKACFKASFQQDYDDYAKFRKLSKEEAQKEVEDLNRESILAQVSSLGLTDEQKESFYQTTMKCYSKVKFEVGKAEKGDNDSYTVTVSYEPVDCFTRFATEFEGECANRPEVLEDQSKLADFMIEFLGKCADEVTYGETESLSVVIEKQDNVYQLAQGELEKVDAAFSAVN